MEYIYHITDEASWERAVRVGSYATESLAAEGFIHCSTENQVAGTLSRYFSGRTDLVLLKIQVGHITQSLRLEPAHDELFPHLYSPLPCSAVETVYRLELYPDGSFSQRELTGGSGS